MAGATARLNCGNQRLRVRDAKIPNGRITSRTDRRHTTIGECYKRLGAHEASITDSDVEDLEESHTELLARQLGAEIIGEEKHGF